MFKISTSNAFAPFDPESGRINDVDFELLNQFCVTETWSGDLSNGLFRLGETSAEMHGLAQRDCGLLNLISGYDMLDRSHVLELFEKAATTSSSFCYSTTIQRPDGQKQPMFCVGESSGLELRYSGTIVGVFFFPRFQIAGTRIPLRQQ
ncbi:hypothetical protein [Pararhizobium sp.]|uniref:hypothetical protein n=1 Tax=Pararhizobium sp. TaxID=1977563 RepID=UPI0027240227|nr:hypothetical protein [Pararhizobium sp.]MDO9415625.1 hypothetical protein [Pararhizobium sp.]